MNTKVLLIALVFFTMIGLSLCGSILVEACNEVCGRDGPVDVCCRAHGYKTGHCANFWFTRRAWCD